MEFQTYRVKGGSKGKGRESNGHVATCVGYWNSSGCAAIRNPLKSPTGLTGPEPRRRGLGIVTACKSNCVKLVC